MGQEHSLTRKLKVHAHPPPHHLARVDKKCAFSCLMTVCAERAAVARTNTRRHWNQRSIKAFSNEATDSAPLTRAVHMIISHAFLSDTSSRDFELIIGSKNKYCHCCGSCCFSSLQCLHCRIEIRRKLVSRFDWTKEPTIGTQGDYSSGDRADERGASDWLASITSKMLMLSMLERSQRKSRSHWHWLGQHVNHLPHQD